MSEIKPDMVVEALNALAQIDAKVYRKFRQIGAFKNGGVNSVTNITSGISGRKQLRKSLAPELSRYMRRSGRFGAINMRGIK